MLKENKQELKTKESKTKMTNSLKKRKKVNLQFFFFAIKSRKLRDATHFNSHVTKRAHPSRYRLALECQNLLYRILSISFIVSNNPRVFLYIWNHQICWQYQGFVIHFRFTADQKFYPRNFFISASNAPLNFSRGPLKHFWHSSLASTLKMHFRGFWHWSAKRNRDC